MLYTLEMNISGNNIAEKYRQRLDRVAHLERNIYNI
jgi:hypothetical protein